MKLSKPLLCQELGKAQKGSPEKYSPLPKIGLWTGQVGRKSFRAGTFESPLLLLSTPLKYLDFLTQGKLPSVYQTTAF